MAVVVIQYRFSGISESKLKAVIGGSSAKVASVISALTVDIAIDDAEKDGIVDMLDEEMETRGFVRITP